MNILLNNLNNKVNKFTSNTNLVFFVSLFVAIYGVFAAPDVPDLVKSLFQNKVFNVSVILLVTYLCGSRNMKLSLFVVLLFLLVTHTISQNGLLERYSNYKNLERFQNLTEVSEEQSEEQSEELAEEQSEELAEEQSEEQSEELAEEQVDEQSEELAEEQSEEQFKVHTYSPKKIKRKLKNILGDVKDLTGDVNTLMKRL